MSVATELGKPVPYAAYPPFPVRRFTVEEYHRMMESGILTEDDKVELLEGWIVPKMSRNPPHDWVIVVLNRLFHSLLPGEWVVSPQCAVTFDISEPEPDFAIVRGPQDRYRDRHPGPEDAVLVVEVADSSLQRDQELKGQIYARAGVPVYWIVNLRQSQVEVYTDPSGPVEKPEYRQHEELGLEDIVPLILDGREVARIPVRDLLP